MRLTPEQRTWLEDATSRYQKNVDQARDYLEGRGLTWDTVHAARLGVVDDDSEGFGGRLAIPYLTRGGVVSLRYRCIRDHACGDVGCFKYMDRPGAEVRLYGVETVFRANESLCVTEGEFDALTLHQMRIAAVAVPGAFHYKPHWRRIFEDFSNVVVLTDGDDAGRKFGNRLVTELRATVLAMPDGMDVNSAYLELGEEYLRGRLGQGTS